MEAPPQPPAGRVQVPPPATVRSLHPRQLLREGEVVIEIDGDSHATLEGQEHDRERDAYLAANGILFLRFWNGTIHNEQDAVLEHIANVCAERAGKTEST